LKSSALKRQSSGVDESVLSAFDDTLLEKSTIFNTEASDVKLAPKASISVKK
jgi:ankyrin repeat protein